MGECVQGAHLRATGKALVEDPERTKDPVDFVQRLLAEKDKYDRSAGLRGHHAGHACLAVQASWAFSVFPSAATPSSRFCCHQRGRRKAAHAVEVLR